MPNKAHPNRKPDQTVSRLIEKEHQDIHNTNIDSRYHSRQAARQASPLLVPLQLANNMEKLSMVPGFILKLWKMINDPQCDDLISWSDNGQSFLIVDPAKFSMELSKYFKHNNLSSFIRQLNMYGFRKVATIENCGFHSGNEDLQFFHPDFVRNKPERLESIKRKLPQKLADSVDLRNVYRGISEIEDKQKDVSKTLQDIKRENEMLWSELHDLRQKHQQQQLYISRLMKLVFEAMEQNGIKTNMLPMKRNPPLMIEAAAGSTVPETTSTTVASPTNEDFSTDRGTIATSIPALNAQSTDSNDCANLLDLTNFDGVTIIPTVEASPNPTTTDQTIGDIQRIPNYVPTKLDDEDRNTLKKSRLTTTDNLQVEDYHQGQHDPAEVSREDSEGNFGLHQDIDLNTPLNTTDYDNTNQFNLVANDELQSQIDSAEYQIDTLVPTIGDFTDDDLNLFTE